MEYRQTRTQTNTKDKNKNSDKDRETDSLADKNIGPNVEYRHTETDTLKLLSKDNYNEEDKYKTEHLT